MIVSRPRKFAFVSSIKCGTNTLYEVLLRFDAKKHGTTFHEEDWSPFKDYFVFTCVRNPIDRAVSLWSSMIQRAHFAGHHDRYGLIQRCPQAIESFDAFAKWLGENWREEGEHHKALQPLTAYHDRTGVQNFVHLENLKDELDQLPFIYPEERGTIRITLRNSSQQFRPDRVSDRAIAYLSEWASSDCERYGYDLR